MILTARTLPGRRASRGAIALVLLLSASPWVSAQGPAAPAWPEVTREARPWTRWWWHGSAVNEADLTRELQSFASAGLGGVEITPIYGVAGYEPGFIRYLTPRWLDVFTHTLRESDRLDLGVDIATGNGWPFGGPWVEAEDASRYVARQSFVLQGGQRLREPVAYTQEPLVRAVGNQIYESHGILQVPGQPAEGSVERPLVRPGARTVDVKDLKEPVASNENLQTLALDQVRFPRPLPLQTLMAYSAAGEVLDLTERVGADGTLDWTAPAGEWKLHALFQGWHGKQVERAGPGGEGDVIDHFSEDALKRYVRRFDEAFSGRDIRSLRSFFNDSYEVDDAAGEANWTPRLLDEFQRRRGYDLRRHLPALFGEDTPERSARVLTDYRQTISDLILEEFTEEWRDWAHGRGATIRNQAHGSPANILDLYAASDIPETEGTDILRIRFASSAAHVSGKRLIAAEASTWLGEHFLSTLADVRANVDRYLLGGVNHVVYHGTAYSPAGDPWPGWLFYAAVHFNDRNPWWTDFAALNRYVGRVQAFLQGGEPDSDLLVYFPIADWYAQRTGDALLAHFSGMPGGPGAAETPFVAAAQALQTGGYAFDFVSDRQLLEVREAEGTLRTGGLSYRAVLVPASRYIPLETMERLVELAREGATIALYRGLPADVAGLADLDARQARFRALVDALRFAPVPGTPVREARVGTGAFLVGDDLDALLARAAVRRETMADQGLRFIRRRNDGGFTYFISNGGDAPVDGWVTLRSPARSAALYDPMVGRTGFAAVRPGAEGASEVYLQLRPGDSRIVRTHDARVTGAPWRYHTAAGDPIPLQGSWAITFVEGGPELPPPARAARLGSWTELPGESVKRFSGTATYTLDFPRPAGADAGSWLLDLGEVAQSARVRLNGVEIGTLLGPGFRVELDAGLLRDSNRLEVSVTNLMANRIADLDRREVFWKKFYNVNFPSRLRENRGENGLFDASSWEPRPSGLLGPVTLTPLATLQP